MDYGFVHQDRTFTPNGTVGITPAENAARNQAIEQAELARWAGRPDRVVAYYSFPKNPCPAPGSQSRQFWPGLIDAVVTTWPGTVIGRITQAKVYRHNFGGRFVSIRVVGTNGAEYYGRASWDWGNVIRLRRVK